MSVSHNGELLPETKAVIAAIAKHDLVMATGHMSAPEALLLLGALASIKHATL